MSTLCTLKGQSQVLHFSVSLPMLLSQLSEKDPSRSRLNENTGCWKDSSKCLDTILQGQGAQSRQARETCKAFPVSGSLFWLYWSDCPPALKTGPKKRSLQHLLPETGPQDLLSNLTEGEQILMSEVCCRRLDEVLTAGRTGHTGDASAPLCPPCPAVLPTCVQTGPWHCCPSPGKLV